MSATVTRRSVTIRIEMTPDSCLSPNRTKGKHWADREIKKAELDLNWAVMKGMTQADAALDGFDFTAPMLVTIRVFWEKGRKTMDGDNLLASLKRGCIDELARQLGMNDKLFQFAPIEQTRDPEGSGYMVVVLEGVSMSGTHELTGDGITDDTDAVQAIFTRTDATSSAGEGSDT